MKPLVEKKERKAEEEICFITGGIFDYMFGGGY